MSTVTERASGIFAADFTPRYPAGIPMKISFNPEMRMMSHPVEDGSSIVDFSIMLPLLAEVQMMLTGAQYKNVYAQIRESFVKREFLTILADSGAYPNMVIEALPHEQSPDVMGAIPLTIKLTEVMIAKSTFGGTIKPRAKKNDNTVKRGEQAPKQSVAYSIFGPKKG